MTKRKQTAEKKSGNQGAKTLNREAFLVLEQRAEEIAHVLKEAAQKGQAMSTRLLIELAGGNMNAEQTAAMRPFRKLLLDLAAEQQLTGEALDAAEAAAAGNPE